jgi:hypothetical protein
MSDARAAIEAEFLALTEDERQALKAQMLADLTKEDLVALLFIERERCARTELDLIEQKARTVALESKLQHLRDEIDVHTRAIISKAHELFSRRHS